MKIKQLLNLIPMVNASPPPIIFFYPKFHIPFPKICILPINTPNFAPPSPFLYQAAELGCARLMSIVKFMFIPGRGAAE